MPRKADATNGALLNTVEALPRMPNELVKLSTVNGVALVVAMARSSRMSPSKSAARTVTWSPIVNFGTVKSPLPVGASVRVPDGPAR